MVILKLQFYKDKMLKRIFPYAILILIISCKSKTKEKAVVHQESKIYTEQYRPQYHFSPPEKWMNDPNGLVYNNGLYHLFYQYYPEDIVWGPMHWGHAVSHDMVHWKHKPIALYPDEHGLIFSGSAVVDKNNTSGFGVDGKEPLVAVFTYHFVEGEKAGRNDFQTQGIAYSLDNGDTWTKYDGNPVIDNKGIRDFRDPKVFWHDKTQSWILVLVAGDHAKFYTSKDLKKWRYLSEFGKYRGAHGGVWECPDLFPLKVEGTDEEKWVLIISINPGAPNGGSGTQYFIGDFDGTTFTSTQKKPKWLDYGTDNYAGVTYNNTPDGKRIFIGWMSNWDYARNTPTKKWRSAMTIPRELLLKKIEDDYVLASMPLAEINTLATAVLEKFKVASGNSDTLNVKDLNQSKITFTTASRDFKLIFSNDLKETLVLAMNLKNNGFIVDRMKSGDTGFQSEFGNKKHFVPIKEFTNEFFDVNILLDWSSIEIFLDNGIYSITEQIFPTEPFNQLIIENLDYQAEIENGEIKFMKSVW